MVKLLWQQQKVPLPSIPDEHFHGADRVQYNQDEVLLNRHR